jgi:hypothetical protein
MPPDFMTMVDTTVLQNNEVNAQQNQIDWSHKTKPLP